MKKDCPFNRSTSIKTAIIALATLALTTQISAKRVLAAVSLTVSPPKIDLNLDLGEKAQKTIKITNATDKPVTVKATVQDFIVQDDNGTPIKVTVEEAGRFVASPWFVLDKTKFTIQPQKTEVVTVLINTPLDALPGGHYSAVYFEPQLSTQLTTTGAKVSPQVGSLFSIMINGDITYDAMIKKFKSSKRTYEFGPVQFSATIENLSTTHISPTPFITITDPFGREIDKIVMDKTNIFPFRSRTLNAEWEQVWGLGKYHATLTVPFGQGSVRQATIFFWIIPWRLITAILIVILTLIAIFISVRRHLHHKFDTRNQEIEQLKRKIAELENKKN